MGYQGKALVCLFAVTLMSIITSLNDISKFSAFFLFRKNVVAPKDDVSMVPSMDSFYDRSITWSLDIHRHWLDDHNGVDDIAETPPAQLLITNYGWNMANQSRALEFFRSQRQRELLRGIINHPWFHPTTWEKQYNRSTPVNNQTRYYVFLDFETCYERLWPWYGRHDGVQKTNADREGDRTGTRGRSTCEVIEDVLNQPVMQVPGSKLILFDCDRSGPATCLRRNRNRDERIALVSISAHSSQHIASVDQGMPPPACKPFELNQKQREDVRSCNDTSRPILASFVGTFRSTVRQNLRTLHNCKDMLIEHPSIVERCFPCSNYSYGALFFGSKFALTPRGDNLFSYRFTEAMSAAAIPVIHSDDYVMPFQKELVDWSKCSVVIREADFNKTRDILLNISAEEQCRMRQNVVEVYNRFMKTGEGTISGIIEGLEYAFRGTHANYSFSPS